MGKHALVTFLAVRTILARLGQMPETAARALAGVTELAHFLCMIELTFGIVTTSVVSAHWFYRIRKTH